MDLADVDAQKQAAAYRAVEDFVQSSMIVGLGTGSTAIHATMRIGELLKSGELSDVVGVPTAKSTQAAAIKAGVPLLDDSVVWDIDVTIDGADEVDSDLNLIKGGGGALLREKLVAQTTATEVIVVDESKRSPLLGTNFKLPVEVVEFGLATTREFLALVAGEPTLRVTETGEPFRTDQGNVIFDCHTGAIEDVFSLAGVLEAHAGIVEHGLFLGLTQFLVVASLTGVEILSPS
ncbi:MAG: ribose-5-phosphate isomerase RpiA [Acidimicrobiia bacterium]|nr:ribose-5-phosphate isomerase RpiA [Acidimicrobiia bacterium]